MYIKNKWSTQHIKNKKEQTKKETKHKNSVGKKEKNLTRRNTLIRGCRKQFLAFSFDFVYWRHGSWHQQSRESVQPGSEPHGHNRMWVPAVALLVSNEMKIRSDTWDDAWAFWGLREPKLNQRAAGRCQPPLTWTMHPTCYMRVVLLALGSCRCLLYVSANEPEPETPDWRMTLKTIRNGIHKIDTYLNAALDLFGGDDGLCHYKCSDGE